MLRSPEIEDEKALCQWLQRNLNHGNKRPSAGKYSLEVVVGWSRLRILMFVVVPIILFLTGTTAVAIALSVVKGNIGWFGVANYCSGLAAGELSFLLTIPAADQHGL